MRKLDGFLLYAAFFIFLTSIPATAQAPVPLGTASTYAVLAGNTITNTGPTTIRGDIGVQPGSSVTGNPTVIGNPNINNASALRAKNDLRTAYLNAAGRAGPILLAGGELGGRTLTPGVYKGDGASLRLTGTLTLNFQGNPNAVFIFQSSSTLITSAGSKVVLTSAVGSTGCNVFWQLGSAATLGTGSVFLGTILAHDDISVMAGASVTGRLLAGGQANGAGAVTLNNNGITASQCGLGSPAPAQMGLGCPAAAGQIGVTYTSAAAANGGTPPYVFSLASGALPTGLTLNTVTGAITGKPATAGLFPFAVRVTDALGGPATISSCIIAIPQPSLAPTLPDLTLTKSHLGDFQLGHHGSFTLTVGNAGSGPATGTVTVSDTLPVGLTATTIEGTGWDCILPSANCMRSDGLASGASYPPITVTVDVADDPLIFNGNSLAFQPGDILLSMEDGTVQWRRRDWTLVKTMTSRTDGQAEGMAFDTTGNLFLTHYSGTGQSGNGVVKFDSVGNIIGWFGSGYDCKPSTIVFDKTGNAYIGQAECGGNIVKLDSEGNRLAEYDVAIENRGSSHVLLDPDQCTMYYTSEGRNVKRFNVCTNMQMPDFNNAPLPDGIKGAHQFALLPDGGLLVADFGVIARLDASGDLVRTYEMPAATHCWTGVALDPDGTSFWSTNLCSSSVTRFDLATGSVIESHVAADPAFMVKEIVVAPPGLSVVVINTAVVSGSGEVNLSNNSASDSTTIITQPPIPVLSMGSQEFIGAFGLPLDNLEGLRAYCTGAFWSLRVSNTLPNTPVRLIGTTNGEPWVIAEWATTDVNGRFTTGGKFVEGVQASYTLKVEVDGRMSNTLSLEVSNCGR